MLLQDLQLPVGCRRTGMGIFRAVRPIYTPVSPQCIGFCTAAKGDEFLVLEKSGAGACCRMTPLRKKNHPWFAASQNCGHGDRKTSRRARAVLKTPKLTSACPPHPIQGGVLPRLPSTLPQAMELKVHLGETRAVSPRVKAQRASCRGAVMPLCLRIRNAARMTSDAAGEPKCNGRSSHRSAAAW